MMAVVVLLIELLATTVHADSNITGSWYGQRIEQGKLLHWIIENRSDGITNCILKNATAIIYIEVR